MGEVIMKCSTNEITGANLVSKSGNQEAYAEGYDRIFGKKKEEPEKGYSKPIILSNKIQCNKCKDIIESKHRHDFVTCSCGAVSVDGGKDYLRRLGTDYSDLSEITSKEEEDYFESIRNSFTWGSYGPKGDQPKYYILLKDMTTEHINAILDTQWHIKGTAVEEWFKMEIGYRNKEQL